MAFPWEVAGNLVAELRNRYVGASPFHVRTSNPWVIACAMDELTWMQASRTQTFSRHASSYCTGRAQENPVLQIDVVTLDERNFDQVVAGGSTPLVVRFWAPWCGSCRALAPTFGDLSREYVNRAKFAEVNVDENPSLARRFLVRAIPTILVLHRGVVLGHTIGARSDLQLRAILDAAM